MKIVHIAPNAPYNEGWSYQENLLPKYQMKMGNDVVLIVTNMQHSDNGLIEVECTDTITSDGFRVIRLPIKKTKIKALLNVLSKLNVMDILLELRPDFIFYHGLGTATLFQVTRYKRKINPSCIIVQDNHLDYNIGFNPFSLKGKSLKTIVTCLQHINEQYVSKIYGVTPWRKDYAENVFGVNKNKTDVLIMGADDDELCFTQRERIRKEIRFNYGIKDSEFVIITGGRIDEKKKIHLLMEAVNQLENVKLIVFGSIQDDIKDIFDLQISNKIIYVGFIKSKEIYNYFFASDLCFFPGQHSVLWEQACASKTPCVFQRWKGMEHVNNGGNSIFIDSPITSKKISGIIKDLVFTDKYEEMKKIAKSTATDIYLYSRIAEKSLECSEK